MLRGATARARGVRILLAAAALAGQQTDALKIDPEARDAVTEAAPPGCAGSPGSSLLIVHVGPPKTGTTSFQEYIHEDRDWIRATHAVEIATNTSKEAHEIAQHLRGWGEPGTDQGSYDGHMAGLLSVLRVPGTKAVISSEVFSNLDVSAWRTFLHGLAHGVEKGAAHVEVRVVMAHRSLADAIRSEWEEWSKYGQTSELIDRFAAYSEQGSSSGEPERELHRLGVLKDTFGSECVHGVSYESLEDEKRSMADFVLCAVAGGK